MLSATRGAINTAIDVPDIHEVKGTLTTELRLFVRLNDHY